MTLPRFANLRNGGNLPRPDTQSETIVRWIMIAAVLLTVAMYATDTGPFSPSVANVYATQEAM